MSGDHATEIASVLGFVRAAERLKCELRHSWLSDGRQESVAEHSWMMSLLAILLGGRLAGDLDQAKVLKMAVLHDIAEAITGDIPSFEESRRQDDKPANEAKAMDELSAMLPETMAGELREIWQEYEAHESAEAKFVTALDKLEVQIQHNLADIATWQSFERDLVYTKVLPPCSYDPYLAACAEQVIADAEAKMTEVRIDVPALRRKHGFE